MSRRLGCILALLLLCCGGVLAAAKAAPAAQLFWRVTPWRSVKFSWTQPNAQLYISTTPITSLNGLTPYAIAPVNLGMLWDTAYTYDQETDPMVVETDANKPFAPRETTKTGWIGEAPNVFPDLLDAAWNGADGDCNLTPGDTPRQAAPVFTFDKPYLLHAIHLLTKVAATGNDPSTIEVFAGTSREQMPLIKQMEVVLPRAHGVTDIPLPVTRARYVKVRLTTRDHDVTLEEVELMGTNDFTAERAVEVNDLAIGGRYYAAIGANGKVLATAKVDVPKVLDKADMSEHFGVNVHFEEFYGNIADIEKSAQLISQAGIKYIRWYGWSGYPRILACLRKYDIAPYMLSYVPGCVATGSGNEPEGATPPRTPQSVVDFMLANRVNAKKDNPGYLVGGPTTMGDSVDYVRQVLRLMTPDQLDYYDFHTYTGKFTTPAYGCARDVPENVATLYQKNRAVMKECGFGDKPIVASEYGCNTAITADPSETITPARQAINLVRSTLANTAQGAKLCIWYDYINDGTDPRYGEHNFGIVAHDFTPKPAYYAYQYLTKMVGPKRFVGVMPQIAMPTLGYDFAALTGMQHTYIFVNAGKQRSTLTLQAAPGTLALTDIFGHRLPLTKVTATKVTFAVADSPVYLVAPTPIRVLAAQSQPLPTPRAKAIAITLPSSSPIAPTPGPFTCTLQLTNSFTRPVTATVTARCAAFASAPRAVTVTIKPDATVPVSLPVSLKATALALTPLTYTITTKETGVITREAALYTLPRAAGAQAVATDLNGDGRQEVIVENSDLHLLIAPYAGSRLVRLIDKRTNADQLFLPSLARGGVADITENALVGEYLCINGYPGVVYNAPFTGAPFTTPEAVGVEMEGTVPGGLAVRHRVELPTATPDTVVQQYAITNTSASAQTFTMNTHPELTPGGVIHNGKVRIEIPTGQINAFVQSGSDVGRLEPSAGWWTTTNTENGYGIRCTFDAAQIGTVRQWHGDTFFNMELTYKPITLQPGETFTARYAYQCSPKR